MEQRKHLVDVSTVVALLSDRTMALCAHILPNGHREGHEWRVGSAAGEPGQSMAVHLTGDRAGVWCDFSGADRDRGDALDLVAQVCCSGDKKRAFAWALAWLGLERADPRTLEIQRRRIADDSKARKQRSLDDEKRRAGNAQRIYLSSAPKIAGTPVEAYLRGRGMDFSQLGRVSRALRYHPSLQNTESGRAWPAMVAAINDPQGNFAAVHRTWLEIHADGRVSKAPLRDPKLSLGRYVGGGIRLWRGETGKPFKDAQAGEWITIGEGIEDTLTAVLAKPELRAMAAVSLSNMGTIVLPAAIEGVFILAQNDGDNPDAARALERAIRNFQAAGKRVRLARPPAHVKDINELLQNSI